MLPDCSLQHKGIVTTLDIESIKMVMNGADPTI